MFGKFWLALSINLDTFPLLNVKNRGKLFTFFLPTGKNYFFFCQNKVEINFIFLFVNKLIHQLINEFAIKNCRSFWSPKYILCLLINQQTQIYWVWLNINKCGQFLLWLHLFVATTIPWYLGKCCSIAISRL